MPLELEEHVGQFVLFGFGRKHLDAVLRLESKKQFLVALVWQYIERCSTFKCSERKSGQAVWCKGINNFDN